MSGLGGLKTGRKGHLVHKSWNKILDGTVWEKSNCSCSLDPQKKSSMMRSLVDQQLDRRKVQVQSVTDLKSKP